MANTIRYMKASEHEKLSSADEAMSFGIHFLAAWYNQANTIWLISCWVSKVCGSFNELSSPIKTSKHRVLF